MKTAMIAAIAMLVSTTATLAQDAAEPHVVSLDHGISLVMPQGWAVENRKDNRTAERGWLSVYLVCNSEVCERTQETCRISLAAAASRLPDDAASLAALHDDPATRYSRMRAVRIATSKDAEFRRLLAPMTIGPRDWAVVETDARHNMKSGLFAQTFIGGYKISATCKTCETGEIRHRDAMAMLESVRQD